MRFWIALTVVCWSLQSWAQALKIQPERQQILLGEVNVLKVELEAPVKRENLAPFSLLPAVKMSNKKEKDSVEVEVLSYELNVNELLLKVTAWDSGLVVIPPFAIDKAGELVTEATMFRVDFPKVDENGEILDIYEMSVDLPWYSDFSEKYWWLIDALIVFAFVLGLILVLREKDDIPENVEPEILVAIDEIAKNALEALYKKGQFGIQEQKLHFAEFSDILRSYIASRYHVVTFEKTTSELLNALRLKSTPLAQREQIEQLLSVSDMIKFSKASTDDVEMQRLKILAFEFIAISTTWYENEAIVQKGEPNDA